MSIRIPPLFFLKPVIYFFYFKIFSCMYHFTQNSHFCLNIFYFSLFSTFLLNIFRFSFRYLSNYDQLSFFFCIFISLLSQSFPHCFVLLLYFNFFLLFNVSLKVPSFFHYSSIHASSISAQCSSVIFSSN